MLPATLAVLSDQQTAIAAAFTLQLLQLFVSWLTNRKVKAVRSEQKIIKASLPLGNGNSPSDGGEK